MIEQRLTKFRLRRFELSSSSSSSRAISESQRGCPEGGGGRREVVCTGVSPNRALGTYEKFVRRKGVDVVALEGANSQYRGNHHGVNDLQSRDHLVLAQDQEALGK